MKDYGKAILGAAAVGLGNYVAPPPKPTAERPRFDYIEERLNQVLSDLQQVRQRLNTVGDRLGVEYGPETAGEKNATAHPQSNSVAGRMEDTLCYCVENLNDICRSIERLERL